MMLQVEFESSISGAKHESSFKSCAGVENIFLEKFRWCYYKFLRKVALGVMNFLENVSLRL